MRDGKIIRDGTGPPVNEKGDAPAKRSAAKEPNRKVQESLSHSALNARLMGEQEVLTCSFPRWSPEAVITEAARNWNLLHPGKPFDPVGSDWAFACIVITSWLRHAVSNYDAICAPANRSELQKEIRHRARLAYPWLSKEIDPRSGGNAQPIVRPLDQIGSFLTELSSHRSAALLALQDARRKHEWQNIQALEAEIAEADRQMQALYRMVVPDKHGDRDVFWLSRLRKGQSPGTPMKTAN